jgi:hypothetical protein
VFIFRSKYDNYEGITKPKLVKANHTLYVIEQDIYFNKKYIRKALFVVAVAGIAGQRIWRGILPCAPNQAVPI